MFDIVFFYPEGHEAHAEPHHPERPERVEAIRTALKEVGLWEQYPRLHPLDVPRSILTSVHTRPYVDALKDASQNGTRLDMDTYLTSESYRLALQAAGGALSIATAVWLGRAKRGFALTRPPGHHATHDQAMGFCLLNNVALAAEYLLREHRAKRIAIVDIDLHHGNGTQDIFYERDDVMFISTHQSPLYPGTGSHAEVGQHRGKGATVNIPLPPFSGDQAFLATVDEVILPMLNRFKPNMILVSAGFDTHWRDPLGYLLLSAQGYYDVIARLSAFADAKCRGRLAMFLEGGYDLQGGSASAVAAVSAMLGAPFTDSLGQSDWEESDAWWKVLRDVREYWDLI